MGMLHELLLGSDDVVFLVRQQADFFLPRGARVVLPRNFHDTAIAK
jgi:hypothetical protein